jgi:hypothetical protein
VGTDVQAESDLQTIRQALTTAGDTPGDPVPSTVDDLNAAGLNGGNTFTGLLAWQLPAHTSTCPTPSLNLFGHGYTITAHCTLAQNTFGVLRAAMIVFFSIIALFIVLKA